MAKAPEFLALSFPTGGVNRRTSYQTSRPYFSPDANNWIPDESILGRERGGTRPGFTPYGTTASAPVRALGDVRYIAGGVPTSRMVAVVNGSLYGDNGSGTWSSKGSSLPTDAPLQIAAFLQKLYIGFSSGIKVWDPVAASYGSLSGDDTLIDPGSYGAFSQGTIAVASGVVTLTQASVTSPLSFPKWAAVSGYLTIGTTAYRVATWTSGTSITLADTSVNAASGTDFILQSRFGVAYQDEASSQHAPAPPTNCRLLCRWANRLVCAGDGTLGIYISGVGNPGDWRYALTNDAGAAVALTAAPNAGSLGDLVTALIPHNDSCLIIAMRASIVVLRGNPASGGSLDTLSDSVGVLSAHSWCKDDEDFLWFMSNRGLYVMPPGCGSTPTAVSVNSLPKDLVGIDASIYYVTMAYDARYRGLHICVNPILPAERAAWINGTAYVIGDIVVDTGVAYRCILGHTGHEPPNATYWVALTTGTAQNYFVATKTTLGGATGGNGVAAMWPQSYAFSPACIAARPHFTSGSTVSPVLFGSTAGAFSFMDSSVACETAGYVDYGPIPLAPEGYDGMLESIDLTLAANSDQVTLSCRVAAGAEAAYLASAFDSIVCSTAGLNAKWRPRAGGGAAVIRIASGTNKKCAVEAMRIKRSTSAVQRVD